MLIHRFALGDLHQAIEYGEESLAIARDLGLDEQQAYVLNDLQYTYIMTGDCRRAREFLEDALVQ